MEQGLGHVTHTRNLQARVDSDPQIDAEWMLVPYQADDIWENLPPMSVKMGLRTRRLLRATVKNGSPECLFFHTQVLSLLNYDFVRRIPSVISLDATPHDFTTMASSYDAKTARGALGRLKHRWYRRVFERAVGLVAISNWVRESLIADYAVPEEKIIVIPYGVDLSRWKMSNRRNRKTGKLKLLFVGGDFKRKGGYQLLKAFRDGLAESCELDIVTRDDISVREASIRVHKGLEQGAPALRQLFSAADIFVLPTRGDTSSIVSMEAMATGLPVVSTRAGAIPEVVKHGCTGYLLDDTESGTIKSCVLRMLDDRDRRLDMGDAGRQRVEHHFDARKNCDRLLEFLKERVLHERTSHAP